MNTPICNTDHPVFRIIFLSSCCNSDDMDDHKEEALELYNEIQRMKYDPTFKLTKEYKIIEKMVERNYLRHYKQKQKLKDKLKQKILFSNNKNGSKTS